ERQGRAGGPPALVGGCLLPVLAGAPFVGFADTSPKGGRDGGCDGGDYVVEAGADVFGGEAEGADSVSGEPRIALEVAVGGEVVLATVDLDEELCGLAVEVEDIGAERVLSAE